MPQPFDKVNQLYICRRNNICVKICSYFLTMQPSPHGKRKRQTGPSIISHWAFCVPVTVSLIACHYLLFPHDCFTKTLIKCYTVEQGCPQPTVKGGHSQMPNLPECGTSCLLKRKICYTSCPHLLSYTILVCYHYRIMYLKSIIS